MIDPSPFLNYDILIDYCTHKYVYNQNILYEPKEAIFVSNINPLIYYEQILKIAKEQINKKHLIAFEIDEDHKEDMHKLCKKYFPSDNIVIEKDLAGKNRYAFIYSE